MRVDGCVCMRGCVWMHGMDGHVGINHVVFYLYVPDVLVCMMITITFQEKDTPVGRVASNARRMDARRAFIRPRVGVEEG